MKNLIKSIKAWRDRRFKERIDRVYFRHSGDGHRYIEGCLCAVKDTQTGEDGMLCSGGYLTYEVALALKENCKQTQSETLSKPHLPKGAR